LGRKKLKSATRISYEKSRNNFPYRPFAGASEIRLDHAKMLQKGIMQSFEYALHKNQKLIFHFWHQDADREIPPLLTQTESLAQQQDRATRMAFIFKKQKSNSQYEWKLGYFAEQNEYQDEKIRLRNANLFTTLTTDFAHDWIMKPWLSVSLGTTHSYTGAKADAYRHQAYEYQGAIFFSSQATFKKFRMMAALRKQWVDNQSVPLVPLLSFQYAVTSEVKIKGKLSRDYRLPTLNDRFWIPGGNPDLRAENGWSQEITFSWDKNIRYWSWSYQVTGYNRLIYDWIIWNRQDGQSFFSPENIAKVWSRGVEQNFSVTHASANGSIESTFHASYTCLKSTNEIAVVNPVLAKGQQLIYTPRQQSSIGFSVRLKKMTFSYRHLITGDYEGINQNLPGFNFGNLEINALQIIFRQNAHLFFKMDNIWNREYQLIENRPMPGRNYRMGLKLKIIN
jgi:iron complex outermembrane receptor protein